MEAWLIWVGIALCVASLAALAWQDWQRLTKPSRRVMARVIGHRSHLEDGGYSFAALYQFTDVSGTHEVVDVLFTNSRRPAVGVMRELIYPAGRPDLARPPRRWLVVVIYAILLVVPAILLAKWLGWLH